jgi:hypothetical protein
MATKCFIPILGKRIRVTTLNSCGAYPAPGTANSALATDGFISVNLTSEVEEGTEIITRKADGTLCVNDKQSDSFKRFTAEIEFCGVNPSLLSLVSNASVYSDGVDNIGITVPEGTINKQFALELWTGLAGEGCVPGAESAGGYMLLPFVQAGVLGDITIDGENAVSFSLTGAYTKGNNAWGSGPYKILKSTSGAVSEVQRVTITGTPTGGTFTLTYNGQTTAPIAHNATAANVQTALEALSNIGSGDVVCAGGPLPGAFVSITFAGALANQDVPQMTVTGTFSGGTTPAAAVTTTTAGAPGAPAVLPTAIDDDDHLLLIQTDLAPPASACGLIAMPV